jgi:Spy/CpxP family protein refolding chaperone
MKKGIIIFGILIAFMLISSLPGQAQRYWWQGMQPSYGMDLTEEQLAKIQEMRLAFYKTILPLQSQIQTHYLELRSMYSKDVEQAQIDARMAQIDKLELDLEQMFVDHQNQIRGLLTEEQKAIFDRWGGLGLGMRGMGLGMGLGMGYGYGRGLGRGFGRAWNRGFGQGWGRGMGRAWSRGPGRGRGFWCPWYQQRRPYRPRDWRRY